MVSNSYKSKAKSLVAKARERGLIKSYSQFCKTEEGKDSVLSKDEVNYYKSRSKGAT